MSICFTGGCGEGIQEAVIQDEEIYKQYHTTDGSVMNLTREEFERLVTVFKMLLNQDEKLRANSAKVQSKESPSSNVPFSSLSNDLK